jgi:uncharacterized membrane protein YbhN (UPF0104 family)
MTVAPNLKKNFIASLFDFKLEHLVSLKFLKFIYLIFTVGISLVAGIGLFLCLLRLGEYFYFVPLIVIGYLLVLISFRIWIELISSLLQIARNTHELVEISKFVAKNE